LCFERARHNTRFVAADPTRLTVVFLLLLLLALSTNAVPDGVSAFRLLLLLLALLENVRSHWEQGLARAGVKSGCR